MRRYGPSDVAGVGGRTDKGRPHEESEGVDRVGMLLPNVQLTGHCAALMPGDVDVDHPLGANMSIRRDVLEAVGGIQDFEPSRQYRRRLQKAEAQTWTAG